MDIIEDVLFSSLFQDAVKDNDFPNPTKPDVKIVTACGTYSVENTVSHTRATHAVTVHQNCVFLGTMEHSDEGEFTCTLPKTRDAFTTLLAALAEICTIKKTAKTRTPNTLPF
jgi:hypothetical protein